MNSSKNSIRSSKKKDYEILIRGVSRVQRRVPLPGKSRMNFSPGGIFPPIGSPKKKVWDVPARGVSRVQWCPRPPKKTRGWIPSGRNFPPRLDHQKRKYGTSLLGGFPVYSGARVLQKNLRNGIHPGRIFPPIGSPKNPGMDSIREEFSLPLNPQKKGNTGRLRQGVSHVQRCPRPPKKPPGGNPSGRNFLPDRILKKGNMGRLHQGGFPCTMVSVPSKKTSGMNSIREEFSPRLDHQKTRGWIPSGRNFSPDRIPKKKEVWDVLA